MNKKILVPLAVAAVVAAGYVGYVTYGSQSEEEALLMDNVEALASGDDGKYRYPDKSGDAKFCTLYVYMKAGVVVASGEDTNSNYEGKAEFIREKREGLKDRCPDKGSGCNPYSCQEVSY